MSMPCPSMLATSKRSPRPWHRQTRLSGEPDYLTIAEGSLLPAPMHVAVANHCIQHGKHLVTASYISPEMKALHERAQESNVVLLGECGLDPGIDSM